MNKTRPNHYVDLKIEPIDAIEAWDLNFCLGNVVKYVARNGRKKFETSLDDLLKAKFYLEREIERVNTECLVRSDGKESLILLNESRQT